MIQVNTSGLRARSSSFKNIARRVMRYYGKPLLEEVRDMIPVDTGAANVSLEQTISERRPNVFAVVIRPKKTTYTNLYSRRVHRRVDRTPSQYLLVILKRKNILEKSRARWNTRYLSMVKTSLRGALNGVYSVVPMKISSRKVKLNRYRKQRRR